NSKNKNIGEQPICGAPESLTCPPAASRRLDPSRNWTPALSSATKAVRQAKTPVFSASNDPVRTCAHYDACAGPSCGQARKTRLRDELPSHAQAQMTSLT